MTILERIKARPRILEILPHLFYAQRVPESKKKELAEKFKRGIAEALGVPPEAIREDVVERWATAWIRAFVKPEYWGVVGVG